MFHLQSEAELNHRRFVVRIIQTERVWGIRGPQGFLPVRSDQVNGLDVLPFWSDAAYARRSAHLFEEAEVDSLELFEFLFRWLPGMSEDGLLAGTNWTGDLTGREVEALELQDEILEEMPCELVQRYFDRLQGELGRGD